MSKKEGFIKYLYRFLGRPYIWGGDGSGAKDGGFDCSGLVLEGLWAFGLYTGRDTNCAGLKKYAAANWSKCESGNQGALLFFGTTKNVSHVAVAIGGGLMIEAGGGDSRSTNAANSTGFIRIRPVTNRADFLAAYMPNF